MQDFSFEWGYVGDVDECKKGNWCKARSLNKRRIYDQKFLNAFAKEFVRSYKML